MGSHDLEHISLHQMYKKNSYSRYINWLKSSDAIEHSEYVVAQEDMRCQNAPKVTSYEV